jgi:hypothetical protein
VQRPAARLRLALLVPLALGGCAARDASVADDVRTRMVGVRADDLRPCAGPPDKRETSEAGEFWTYDRTPTGGGVSVPVPVPGGM